MLQSWKQILQKSKKKGNIRKEVNGWPNQTGYKLYNPIKSCIHNFKILPIAQFNVVNRDKNMEQKTGGWQAKYLTQSTMTNAESAYFQTKAVGCWKN